MVDRRFRLARIWSNRQLKLIAPLIHGRVANISAGTDEDKEGDTYENYFCNAISYELTNYGGAKYRGFSGRPNERELDLTSELPTDLVDRYDAVFNHTTLEHIFDVTTAFCNFCRTTKDIAIIIVPFAQVQHDTEGYQDFWRFTPTCCRRLFEVNGMTVVYEAANNDFNAATYLFIVASKHPEVWATKVPHYREITQAASWLGRPLVPPVFGRTFSKVRRIPKWLKKKIA